MDNSQAIIAKNIKKSFGTNEVFKGINLSVPKGKVLALLGPNGAGKTTMVRIFTTLLKPDSGEVFVSGYDVLKEPEKVQTTIGLTGQFTAIDGKLTGLQNLRMIGRLYHLSLKDARRRSEELIELFDLVKAANRPAKTYSGGMKRRLDLAASLIMMPPILFLDEPTTGLDPNSRNATWDIVRELVNNGTTVLLTTQYLDEADQLANQIAVIDNGTIIAEGTPSYLKSQIGGERLEIVFADNEDISKVNGILSNDILGIDEENKKVSFSLDKGNNGITKVNYITSELIKSGVQISEFSTFKPTLDDVFLKLTHKSVESNVVKEEK